MTPKSEKTVSLEGTTLSGYGMTARFVGAQLGAGYTFLRQEKFTLSAFGMLGFEGALYQTEKKLYIHKELGAVKRSLYAWVPALSLGTDITAVFYPMPQLGIFCNIAARFLPASAMQNGAFISALWRL